MNRLFNAESKPTMKYLKLIRWTDEQGKEKQFRLMDKIGTKWQVIGQCIGLASYKLDLIDRENRETAVRLERVMTEWLCGEGAGHYPVTWEGLYHLLEEINMNAVALGLREAVTKSSM